MYTLHTPSSFHQVFRDFTPTQHGINILGGYCNLVQDPTQRVVIKRVQSRSILYTSFIVDQLKPLFGVPSNGEWGIDLTFATQIHYERAIGDRSNELKAGNYLVQRCIPGETWGDWTHRLWNPGTTRLWLPTEFPDTVSVETTNFIRAFLFRMIVGIRDPGPHNFMIHNRLIYSIDETSAFGANMDPSGTKRWLEHNLTGPIALAQMRDPRVRENVAQIQREWLNIVPQSIQSIIDTVPLSSQKREHYLMYIQRNIERLVSDFEQLIQNL